MGNSDLNPYQPPQMYTVPVSQASAHPELASRMARLGAHLIDVVISMAITVPIAFATGYFERVMKQQVTIQEILLQLMIGFGAYLIVHGYLLATQGQTVGKMLVGVRIVDYTDGEIIPIGRQLLMRDLIMTVIAMIPFVGGLISLVGICLIFGAEQRCLHDLLAGTKVVKA